MSALVKKRKILFVRTDPCTVEPRIQKEASTLQRAGYDVCAFGWDRRSEYPRSEIIKDVHYKRTRIPAQYGSKSLVFVMPLFWIRAWWEIFVCRPAVVHACDLDAFVPALIMKPFMRYILIYDIFDYFSEKILNLPNDVRKFIRRIDQALMKYADAIIVTDENRKIYIRHRDLPKTRIIMNVPMNTHLRQCSENGEFQLCYTGNIHEHRGLYVIAEALRTMEGVKTIFAGWIVRNADRQFLLEQPSISYVGKLSYEESLKLLAKSDASLALYDPALPINALASSNKTFEAMSVGRPIITNNETTMAGIVREEQCGITVPYGDVEALKKAIFQLKNDKGLREELGANGRRAFVSKYNWDLMEKELVSLYSEVLSSK